jgi:hypothetical protein
MAFKLQFTLLPKDYVAPAGGDVYMKMAKAGSPIKFVIAGTIVPGYSYWTNAKTKIRSRVPFTETPDIKIEDGKVDRVSHFWCLPVFDTETETVRILEITQSSLQNQLQSIFDGGDYDLSDLSSPMAIKISAAGEKLLTKYTLMPVPVNNPKMISVLEASDLLEPGAVDKLIFSAPATPATEKVENPGKPNTTVGAAQDIM